MRYLNTLIRYVLALTAMTSVTWAQTGSSEPWATLIIENNLSQVKYFTSAPTDDDILLWIDPASFQGNNLPTYSDNTGAPKQWPRTGPNPGYVKLSEIKDRKINLLLGAKSVRIFAIIWKDTDPATFPDTKPEPVAADAGTNNATNLAYALFEYTFPSNGRGTNVDISNVDQFSFPTKLVLGCIPCLDFNCYPVTSGFRDGVTEQLVLVDLAAKLGGPILPPACWTSYWGIAQATVDSSQHYAPKVWVNTNGLTPPPPSGANTPQANTAYRLDSPNSVGWLPVASYTDKKFLSAGVSWQETLSQLYADPDNLLGFYIDYSGNEGYSFRLKVYRIQTATSSCSGIGGWSYGLALTDFKIYNGTMGCPYDISNQQNGIAYSGTIYVLPDGFPIQANASQSTTPFGAFGWPIVVASDQNGGNTQYIGDWTSVLVEQQAANGNGEEAPNPRQALPRFMRGGAQAFIVPDPNFSWINLNPTFVDLSSSPTGPNIGAWSQNNKKDTGIESMIGSATQAILWGLLGAGWNNKIGAPECSNPPPPGENRWGFGTLAKEAIWGQATNPNYVCGRSSSSPAPDLQSFINTAITGKWNSGLVSYMPVSMPGNLMISQGSIMTGPISIPSYASPFGDRFDTLSANPAVPFNSAYSVPGTVMTWSLGLPTSTSPSPPSSLADSPVTTCQCSMSDLSGDGISDGADITVLLACWGADCPQHDLNQDGVIDGIDLAYLLTNLGQTQVLTIPSWADPSSVQCCPDNITVPNSAVRQSIVATGYAWKVTDMQTQMKLVMLPTATAGFSMGCSKPTAPYTCPGGGGTSCTLQNCNNHPSPYSSAFCGCYPDEVWSNSQQSTVFLTQNVYMGVTEVTRAQWQKVNPADPSHYTTVGIHGASCTDLPVQDVSYTAIQSWLRHTTAQFSLPTEAQWEFACRAGSNGAFPYYNGEPPNTGPNDAMLSDQGKLIDFAWFNTTTDWYQGTGPKPVGLLKANWYGLYDMNGNVWEWVADWYNGGPYTGTGGTNPTGPQNGTDRVLRGGNWGDMNYDFLKCSYRAHQPPNAPNEGPGFEGIFGFRVAKVMP